MDSQTTAPMTSEPMASTPAPAQPTAAMGAPVYAGFWWRVLAAIIDGILLGIVLGIVDSILFPHVNVMMTSGDMHYSMYGGNPGSGLLNLAAYWLYFALFESSKWQATIGKHLVGLKVTDMNGDRITFGRATGRYFAKILSTIILFIGYIMVAFTQKKQGLHDLMAKTLVWKVK